MKNPGAPGFSLNVRRGDQVDFLAGALFAGAFLTAGRVAGRVVGRAAGRAAVFTGDVVFLTAAFDFGECGRTLPWLPR